MSIDTLQLWHDCIEKQDISLLDTLLADDAVMVSPVVHTPQMGKAITTKYLAAAAMVFGNEHFKYVRELKSETDAVLEFETLIDGIHINGVDMIKWNEQGQITEFKVMLRPLQAVNKIHQMMGAQLANG